MGILHLKKTLFPYSSIIVVMSLGDRLVEILEPGMRQMA
jgi:hypothetical protein